MRRNGLIWLAFVAQLSVGCTDRQAETQNVKEAADATARAAAARKEMDVLPKALKSRDYFKQNEPDQKGGGRTQKAN